MANDERSSDGVRQPQPDAAAQDPRNAAVQQKVHEDSMRTRDEADRVRATTPSEVSEKTVAEIAEEAERRARR